MANDTTFQAGSYLARFWGRQDLFATTLLVMFLDSVAADAGPEGAALEWRPETIEIEIRESSGVDLDPGSFERLMTAIVILTTDSFFTSPGDFARACVVLSGDRVEGAELALPTCEDAAWGLTEGLLINPPDGQNEKPFSAEITALIGALLTDEGIQHPPDILRIGTRDPQLGNRASYDFSDDPEMFSAIAHFEDDKTSAITSLVAGRTRALLEQLRELPLRHGDSKTIADRLLARLPAAVAPLSLS